MTLLTLALRRLLALVPVLLGVSVIVFLATELLPGDLALFLAGEKASPDELARVREAMGLDDPLPVRFLQYLGNAATGDLGHSRTGRPVAVDLAERFPATLELALAGGLVALFIGLVSGSIAALRRGTWLDRGFMLLALAGVSIPVFWLALELLQLLAVRWPVFPLTGRLSPGTRLEPVTGFLLVDSLLRGRPDAFADALHHLFLPALTLGVVSSALLARMTRVSLLEQLDQDYLVAARAKGVGPARLFAHALRGALIPVVTVLGLEFGVLLSGAVITETIFVWPGMGTYLVNAIFARDIPAVQGAVLVGATAFVLVNFLADLLYHLIDPRVRDA